MKTKISALILSLITTACESRVQKFTDADFEVSVLKYPASEPRGSIIIVPPTGGTNILDKLYAQKFCAAGFDVYILDRWTDDDETSFDLEVHQRFYDRAQKAISFVARSITTPFLGVLGTSVGGIHVTMAMIHLSQINAAFVITAGAPISYVLAKSDQAILVNAKEKRIEKFGFKNDEEYEAALKRVIHWDIFSADLTGKNLGMLISTADGTVPSIAQERLKEFWQPKTIHYLSWGHMTSIILTWLIHAEDIKNFFLESSRKK